MKNVQYMRIYTFFIIIFSLKLSIVVGVVLLQFTSMLILFLRLLAFFFFNPTDRPIKKKTTSSTLEQEKKMGFDQMCLSVCLCYRRIHT